MSFEEEINKLENENYNEEYIIKKGDVPILFIAAHTMEQLREDGTIKPRETYTKAISLYLNKNLSTNAMVKLKDTGLDSNRDNKDKFKVVLLRLIKDNDIKLVIDLHGSDKSRDYDIEFGTLNNLSADYSTIKELEEAFTENGIKYIEHNNPFKGGAITKYVYGLKDVEVIQIEINGRFRDKNHLDELEKLVKCLKVFVKEYKEYINRN